MSVLFLMLAVINQVLWLSWAILVPDPARIIFAAVTGTITVFNLTWWVLRTLGLRPLLAAGHSPSQAMANLPGPTTVQRSMGSQGCTDSARLLRVFPGAACRS